MEFKSLKNIESSFRQIRLFGIVFLSLCAVITVWSVVEFLPLRGAATGKDLRAGQRQVADAGSLAKTCRRTVRQKRGNTCAVSTSCSHALTRKERDRA